MVLNAVHGAGEQWSAEAGNAAALRAYTEARAEAQTVSAYRAIGRQAETWVPMLRIVFECLYVGAFPMAVLLMLTPAGEGIFRSYFSGLVWLQSWGPLYAVLHRIAMGEAAERMGAGAVMPGGDIGVSLVAQAGIRAVASDVAVMSGYLSMSVPFLAAALAYGVGRATSLATSVLSVGQDAASSAAQEGTTGNISLANTQGDTHRFASLEGHQLRTSAHVDAGRYTGFAPGGAAYTVTGEGTAVMDAGSATSRVPAAGVRLSESLATSHEVRAGAALEQARHWSAEAATARTAAATDSAAMVERFSRDARTGLTHARGVTESQNLSAQRLESHLEKLSEAGGITKEQAAVLTGEARVGGGFDFIVKFGADGSASWRGQTFGRETWNRMTDYADQNQLLDHWSRAADASRRYATASGESELKSLDESLGANMTRMRRFSDQEAVSRREAENWSSQAAQVRGRSQSIDSELGQPFFAWLSARTGADGREIGAAGAMRLASPQTPEDAEVLRAHAAAFIAERFPVSGGPEAAPKRADYERASERLRESGAGKTGAAWTDWSASVRERAEGAGAPRPAAAGRQAARAVANPRMIETPPPADPPGAQEFSARTFHHVVPRVVAEPPQGDSALRGLPARRNHRVDPPALQPPVDLREGIARIRRHRLDHLTRYLDHRIHLRLDHCPLAHRSRRNRYVEHHPSLVVHRRMLLVTRLRPPAMRRRRQARVRVRAAHLRRIAAPAPSLLPDILLTGVLRHYLIHVTLHQALPTHVRPNQRGIHVNHFGLRHLRIQARTHRATEYLLETLLPPTLPDTRQTRMIRQTLVQPIPDEPADREVHLRLAHQPTVVYEAQQQARQHQPHPHFRVDSRATVVRAIAIRYFLMQPTQVQYAVHTHQDVILRNQLLQRTGHEQFQLLAPLASQHPGSPCRGRKIPIHRITKPGLFQQPHLHAQRHDRAALARLDAGFRQELLQPPHFRLQ